MTDTIRSSAPARRILPARDLAQIAIFAALIAALGLPGPLNIGPVPITMQTLGVMLAGAILGPRKGTLAVLLFLVLTAVGLPLLAGARGGIGVFTVSPAAGYLYGWLLGAFVTGYLTARLLPKYPFWPALGATILGGIVAVYLLGIPVMAINLGLPLWTAIGLNVAFLPGDLIKVIVTVLVARQVHKAYPGLIALPKGRQGHA
ncbi:MULTISPECIES: biotin transporter BioY [Cryobacterium]|uniref:Biotin transporter n=1 Tax=Cryobacterium levicorallinum TaxID=995038 RepID=A0A1I3AFP4_9MICO|nr:MULTISPECIES: biotin transporter BioY [Cryobacterium]TFB86560.1 biotin transporter BioY [Cryobacterium levicorallinum]TFD59553.1 biotin transporter BioY [Cryobacterium sp. Hh38]GEP26595.1 biotin biosynthesis protein BioY [Cryobacterium levicorallinum]SFH48902.1 biotin transport system substrate-specific component [Cryobacterium levicorallinum]